MNSVSALCASIVIALSSLASVVVAQPYIELEINGGVYNGEYSTVAARAIFDTSAAPSMTTPSGVTFEAIWAEAVDPETTERPSPMSVSLDETYLPTTAILSYVASFDAYFLIVDVPGNNTVQLRVRKPEGNFNLSMTSLPGDPSDYDADLTEPLGDFSIQTSGASAFWNTGNDGGFRAAVRLVDGVPMPDCLVDLNDDGVLDFFDISAFISLYSSGCP
ncbi:MAG: hypothetical protein JJ974_03920 [Phycisphaerales bacterium]|nr:hypothetical protein [Phycisphaerales bacterium]